MSFSTAGSSPPNNPSGQQQGQRRPTQPPPRPHRSDSQHSPSRRTSSITSDPASEQWAYGDAARQTTSGEMEREAGERRKERSSPSVSSSQGDMADNEGEAGPSQSSATAQPTNPPPKKKRTRTLTTPHQSAVLHALLAQSRFPTTAMREEVGRAIGLSARKVQIWFQASSRYDQDASVLTNTFLQNQRQKARRPRGQQSAPLTRPPQFGPFTNVPPGISGDASAVAGPSSLHAQPSVTSGSGSSTSALPLMRAPGPSGVEFFAHQEPHASSAYPRSGSLSQLSGPGIPGPSSAVPPHSALPTEARGTLPFPEAQRGMPAYPGSSPVHLLSPLNPFGSDDAPRTQHASAGGSRRFSDVPMMLQRLTLPPIVDPRQDVMGHSSSSRFPPPLHSFSPPSTSAVGARRGSYAQEQAEPPFAHLPPLNIPPPFTLEPRPQWDDPAFSPFSRPGSSSRSYALPPSINFTLPPMEAMTTRSSETLPPILSRRVEGVDVPHRVSTPLPLRRTRLEHSRSRERPSRSVTPRAGPSTRPFDETTHPSR
ncbi:hypothetical protein FOMPIDRAFT_1062989 [Fomitopsis schrenkii]|uniref:Homeobox domain-containing protein n=1 Tax=Fomitopsis schrenkii TaxID=2126942 RepID=S8F7N8_FOMSC|nr:hypothetical protein FOMPIDRAFT_1062989 [Fomitopsis schrenkii]